MKPNYNNWMPKGMIWSFAAATAVARRNPQCTVTGIDHWGPEYASFSKKLKELGYERAELVPTDNGRFMSPWEAKWMGLSGSALLVGKK